MAKKKAIILIVEGPTDQVVLAPLEQLVNRHKFEIKVMGGDPYTDLLFKNKPTRNIVGDIIKKVMRDTKFQLNDLALVLQLVDTDGAFISEEDFKVKTDINPIPGKTYTYDLSEKVVCLQNLQAKQALIQRWQKKQSHLKALCQGINYNKKVPFFLFFNSLNLEHVTAGDVLSDEEKDEAALAFLQQFGDNLDDFQSFFKTRCPFDTYIQSWQKIQTDAKWQMPKTNLPFLIEKLLDQEKAT